MFYKTDYKPFISRNEIMINNSTIISNNNIQNQIDKQQITANVLQAMPSQTGLSTLRQNIVPLIQNTLSQLKQQQATQNNIVGTAGHDILSSSSESNLLEGGAGYDLAIIQGDTDDYDISIRTVSSQAGSSSKKEFVFTNEYTGKQIVARNIESFRFNDTELTAAELKEYVTDIDLPEELDLSDEMNNKLGQYFNQSTANSSVAYDGAVLDSDGSGKLSKGDMVKLSITRQGDTYLVEHVLTQHDIDSLLNKNNPPLDISKGQPLTLTDEQQAAISARFTRRPTPQLHDARNIAYDGITNDTNGDGQLNEGDSVQLRHIRTFSIQPADQLVDHILTAEDITAINEDRSNPLLTLSNELSDEQRARLKYGMGLGKENEDPTISISYVFDANNDKKISVGDVVAMRKVFPIPGVGTASSITFFQPIKQLEIDKFLSNDAI